MRQRRNGDRDREERRRIFGLERLEPECHARRRHESVDERRGRPRRNDGLAACREARTLEQLVRALRALSDEEAERLLATRPALPKWGRKPEFLAEDVLSWDTRSRHAQVLATFRRAPGGRVIFSQREEWREPPRTKWAGPRGGDAFENVDDEPLFNGPRRRGRRNSGSSEPPFPCTRCGALVSTIKDMKRTCPTPGEPYSRLPPERLKEVGHSLPPHQYFRIQYPPSLD